MMLVCQGVRRRGEVHRAKEDLDCISQLLLLPVKCTTHVMHERKGGEGNV